jgi:Tfp pilus assembly protein FimT
MIRQNYRQGCRLAYTVLGTCVGLTFLELLIVVALIGVITFLGIPYFKPFLEHSWVEKDAWQLLSDLRAYRQQSIMDHYYYRFVFDMSKDTYLVEKRDAATNALIASKPLVTLSSDLVSATEVTFRPRGEASQSSTIIIQGRNSTDKATITVFATTGLAKLEHL